MLTIKQTRRDLNRQVINKMHQLFLTRFDIRLKKVLLWSCPSVRPLVTITDILLTCQSIWGLRRRTFNPYDDKIPMKNALVTHLMSRWKLSASAPTLNSTIKYKNMHFIDVRSKYSHYKVTTYSTNWHHQIGIQIKISVVMTKQTAKYIKQCLDCRKVCLDSRQSNETRSHVNIYIHNEEVCLSIQESQSLWLNLCYKERTMQLFD